MRREGEREERYIRDKEEAIPKRNKEEMGREGERYQISETKRKHLQRESDGEGGREGGEKYQI